MRKNLLIDAGQLSSELLEAAIRKFLDVRKRALEAGAQKPPATSELIDWIHVLHWQGNDAASLQGASAPHWKVLFKTLQDVSAYTSRLERESTS